MPRIRTIKPEFWDSPSTARASAVARLAFIAMWNWADDHGRGTANMKELEGFIFPNDDISELSGGTSDNFRDVVAEVVECFGVVLYEVAGRPYYAIPSWDAHQRNERRAASKYPGPGDADTVLTRHDSADRDDARKFRDTAAEAPNTSGPGTGEQGNRGTGEQGNRHAQPQAAARTPKRTLSRFPEFYAAWPKKKGKLAAEKAWPRAVRAAGSEQVIIDAAAAYAANPYRPEREFIPYPATWLNRGGWEDELDGPKQARGGAVEGNRARAMEHVAQVQAAHAVAGPGWEQPPALALDPSDDAGWLGVGR